MYSTKSHVKCILVPAINVVLDTTLFLDPKQG